MRLSIIVPVYNEEASLPEFARRIKPVMTMEAERYACEVIFVNDGSMDGSESVLEEICRDPLYKSVTFTRNFGHQVALLAGLQYAKGDVLVTIDSDLQDPPEVIPALLREFEKGCDVVHAVRSQRLGESKSKKWFAKMFYRVYRRSVNFDVPVDAGDFRLITRRVKEQVVVASESSQYLRGQIAWFGYSSASVEYERQSRSYGIAKYSFRKSLSLAANAVISLSGLPLRFAMIASLFLSIAFPAIVIIITLASASGIQISLSEPVLRVLISVGFGVLSLSIATIAAYLGRLMFQVRRLPLFVVASVRNLSM
ncbi:MAG: glycosyltransferase family 2 protein [Actinomycetota bacterium]|jgi:dolichol-phosphate mannosyltransferase